MRIAEISDEPLDLYAGTGRIWIGLTRTVVKPALTGLRSITQSMGITVEDETDIVARIAVMGPESRKLLQSMEVSDDQLVNIGNHMEIEVIQEPVRVCRSDFAGLHGYANKTTVYFKIDSMPVATECIDKSWAMERKG